MERVGSTLQYRAIWVLGIADRDASHHGCNFNACPVPCAEPCLAPLQGISIRVGYRHTVRVLISYRMFYRDAGEKLVPADSIGPVHDLLRRDTGVTQMGQKKPRLTVVRCGAISLQEHQSGGW